MTRIFVLLLLAGTVDGANTSAPTLDAALSFAVPSNPRISPDGNRVVYQLGRTNWKENSFESDLWIVDAKTASQPKAIASGHGTNSDAQWSPDGSRIAFLNDRSGRRQIYLVSADGGETRKITSLRSGVTLFHWSPDSKSVAFTTEEDADTSHPQYEIVKAENTRIRFWRELVPAEGAPSAPEEIWDGSRYSVRGFNWSPDGSKIAFQDEGIFVLDVASGKVSTAANGAGPYRNPVWSPDGHRIAFETAGGAAGFYYSNWYVATVASEGGAPESVTRSFDENAELYLWGPSGIYFGALQRTASHLFVADPATHRIRQLTDPDQSTNLQFSISGDGSRFTYLKGTSNDLAEVFLSGGTQLTDYSEQLAPYQFARRELVEWTSTDGTRLEGVLYKPADFSPFRKYPLLVAIHGGPVAVDQPFIRPDRNYPLEQFVAKGALVFRPNYRGSAGYGAKLRALAVRSLGTGDAADIVSGVDSLVAKGFVDPDRVGAMGWSEGGYVAAFLATATQRFKAVSVGAGISDWLTYYVNTDITPFTRQYLQATPWQDPEIYKKASPISYINQAKTPVLIQHGDEDRRVPIPNAYELRQALEDRRVPVRMIVYKGFGHSIDRPKQQRAVMEHNLEWFEEWILDPKASAPLTASREVSARESGDSASQ